MRNLFDYSRRRFPARQNSSIDDGAARDVDTSAEEGYEARSEAFKRFRRKLIDAKREVVLRLRSKDKIGDESYARSTRPRSRRIEARSVKVVTINRPSARVALC